MKNRFLSLCCFFLLSLFSLSAFSQQEAPHPDYELSIYTFSPYDDVFAWFGHTAIELKNIHTGKAEMYNFGGFRFSLGELMLFVQGRFQFWSYKSPTDWMLQPYKREKRHVIIQKLALSEKETNYIVDRLNFYMKEENKYYTYDYFRNNCTTVIMDIIAEATKDRPESFSSKTKSTPTDLTLRMLVNRTTQHLPHYNFAFNFLLSDPIDKPLTQWQVMFLPDLYMRYLREVKVTPPILDSEKEIKLSESRFYTDELKPTLWNPNIPLFFGISVAISALLWLLFSSYRKNNLKFLYPLFLSISLLIPAILGVALSITMFYTDHSDTYYNENLFLLNPLTFIFVILSFLHIFGIAKKPFIYVGFFCGVLAILGVTLKGILPFLDQNNSLSIVTFLPIMLTIMVQMFLINYDMKERKLLQQ